MDVRLYCIIRKKKNFQLKNKEDKIMFSIECCNKKLKHTSYTIYLGGNIDRTLIYKKYIAKMKLEYVQHTNGFVLHMHTNSLVFSHRLLRTLARGLCIVRASSRGRATALPRYILI